MKRFAGFALVTAFLLALPVSHLAISGPPNRPKGKVEICHFPDGETTGIVINVSRAALNAHCTKHGDCTNFTTPPNLNGGCVCPSGEATGSVKECN